MAVIAIVAYCCWRGYKNGLIRGVFGIVSLVVSLFLANVIATAYSEEFTEILAPFIGGIVDSALVDVFEDDGSFDLSGYPNKSDSFITAYSAMRQIGLPEGPAARIAELTEQEDRGSRTPAAFLSDLIADKLSSVLAFVAVFGIAFLLLAIVFAVVGNLVGVVFSLPGLRLVDMIAGAVFGLAKGLLIMYTLAAIVRYMGFIAPDTLSRTALLMKVVNNNPIAEMIGI